MRACPSSTFGRWKRVLSAADCQHLQHHHRLDRLPWASWGWLCRSWACTAWWHTEQRDEHVRSEFAWRLAQTGPPSCAWCCGKGDSGHRGSRRRTGVRPPRSSWPCGPPSQEDGPKMPGSTPSPSLWSPCPSWRPRSWRRTSRRAVPRVSTPQRRSGTNSSLRIRILNDLANSLAFQPQLFSCSAAPSRSSISTSHKCHRPCWPACPGRVDHRIEVEKILRWLRWTIICWIILFWKLRWLSLLDPDEAHYAQLTHEMIRRRKLVRATARRLALRR